MKSELTNVALRIANDRYFNESERKTALTDASLAFDEMCSRVATAAAKGEKNEKNQRKWKDIFYSELRSFTLVPAGRFWANSLEKEQQYPNCFLYPIEDSKESIFNTLKLSASTFSNGGGIGFDFSKLRSRGMPTTHSKGTASGPVSFLKMYDAMADTIVQGGSRRAATMGILRIDHPDILEFIFLKDKTQKFRRFNLSVAVTDNFMTQLLYAPDSPHIVWDPYAEEYFLLKFSNKPSDVSLCSYLFPSSDNNRNYMSRELEKIKKTDISLPEISIKGDEYLTVRDLWECISRNAWECGDPGIFFIDTFNRRNPFLLSTNDTLNPFYVSGTNPCGEQGLENNGICMLTALNLSRFVIIDPTTQVPSVDYKRLKEVTTIGIRFLDNSLDVSSYPSKKVRDQALTTRRIGLGVMGWADMLIKLGIVYGSDKSLVLADTVMQYINDVAFEASVDLGKERGSFPAFKSSNYSTGKRGFTKVKYLRNAYRTTIAPTGTTSLLVNTSSGIEPVYNFEYVRKDETGSYTVRHPLLDEWYAKHPNTDVPPYFISATQIPFSHHIAVQAAFQKHVDNSISKTINMPSNVTIRDIQKAYEQAYKSKCKGITIYRDGSKNVQVLNDVISDDKSKEDTPHHLSRGDKVLQGLTYKVKTGNGTCYITINRNGDNLPIEVFNSVGKAGSDINAYSEALGRIISISLQHGVLPQLITKQLIGISGDSVVFHTIGKYKKVLSVPDAIGKVLDDFLTHTESLDKFQDFNDNDSDSAIKESNSSDTICPNCLEVIRYVEGCSMCGCGSKCD